MECPLTSELVPPHCFFQHYSYVDASDSIHCINKQGFPISWVFLITLFIVATLHAFAKSDSGRKHELKRGTKKIAKQTKGSRKEVEEEAEGRRRRWTELCNNAIWSGEMKQYISSRSLPSALEAINK